MFDPSSYKAFLFDVDKTLTNSQKEVTKRTQAMLITLQQKGYRVGVCTGRHFTTLKSLVCPYFDPADTHIVSGGAQIITSQGEIIWEKVIPHDSAMRITDVLNDAGATVLLQLGDRMYGNEKAGSEWTIRTSDSIQTKIYPISEYPNSGVPLIVAQNFDFKKNQILSTFPEIDFKPMLTYQGIPYADITAKGINKAAGIHQWCTMLGITPEDIVGFGDSENDTEFLQTVGHAVAMGNAIDSIKQIADEVAEDNDHDGVATWIEQNVLV